jgi:DNA segregation ATPase FtsK/SpoIIIE, S-DNA-T family
MPLSCFRTASSLPHERAVTAQELVTLAGERGYSATPQIYRGDQGAELLPARLVPLAGDDAHQAARRSPRLLLGEPVGLGTPVEVLLRREEGANLLIVGEHSELGQGALFSSLASAVVGHGRTLEAWVLDFTPFDSALDVGLDGGLGAGFGARSLSLADRAELHVGRRRYLAKYLDQVHRLVQDRLATGDVVAPTRLLVISGLGRARDFDPRANSLGIDGLDPVEVLAAIMRDGPEVGVHTLVWCESVELLHRRLGPEALREFGVRVAAVMEDEMSVTLLDTPDATRLKPHQALLYDESRGRLVKFRPYGLPAPGWAPLP